jgi:hypothetical protein
MQIPSAYYERTIDFYLSGYRSLENVDPVQLLESADRARTFNRFLDLPPELRNMIYRYVTASPDPQMALVRPEVPAICQAFHQLRAESLPVFYSTNLFAFNISAKVYERRPQQQKWHLRKKSELDDKDQAWLGMILWTGAYRYLRKLLFVVRKSDRARDFLTCTQVDFGRNMQGYDTYDAGVWMGATTALGGQNNGLEPLQRLDESVEGEKEKTDKAKVKLPKDLDEVLRGASKSWRLSNCMTREDLYGILKCWMEGSKCRTRW